MFWLKAMSSNEHGFWAASAQVTLSWFYAYVWSKNNARCRIDLPVSYTVDAFALNLIVSTRAVYWSLRLRLCACFQICVRRGLVAFPSSSRLLHNRPNVFRIRGFLTSSSQVRTPYDVALSCLFLLKLYFADCVSVSNSLCGGVP